MLLLSASSPLKVIIGAECWYLILLWVVKENLNWTIVKVAKADFILHFFFIAIREKKPVYRIGLNSDTARKKWGFIDKD